MIDRIVRVIAHPVTNDIAIASLGLFALVLVILAASQP